MSAATATPLPHDFRVISLIGVAQTAAGFAVDHFGARPILASGLLVVGRGLACVSVAYSLLGFVHREQLVDHAVKVRAAEGPVRGRPGLALAGAAGGITTRRAT